MSVTAMSKDSTLVKVSDFLRDLESPLARECARLLESNLHSEYLNLGSPDVTSSTFRDDYLAVEIASKYPYLAVNVNREAVALEKFHEIEGKLVVSDGWLYRFSKGWNKHQPLQAVFHTARRKIEHLLGPFHWEICETYFSFGPGATVSLPRRKASIPNKFSNPKLTVTQSCLDLAVWAVCRNDCWADYLATRYGRDPSGWFHSVPGNKVVTVPKNAKTDRTIAIEPDLNMFLQKGIGGRIRRRLLTVGVDLDDQTPNQRAALEGSLSGTLGTLDLSSASDSVSLRLVEELLPPDWVDAIKATRSPRGVLPDGSLINYRKVSSMGNGYTFELESLIFWALLEGVAAYHGVVGQRSLVYGDDIILPRNLSETYLEVLSCCGFTPNMKKTHLYGPFRESCGKHYHGGVDVTPFYVKDRVDLTDRLYWFANSISVWAGSGSSYTYLDGRCYQAWKSTVELVPGKHRNFGPLFLNGQMSDICLGVSFDKARPSLTRSPYGLEGWLFPSRVKVGVKKSINSIGSLIGFLDRFGRFALNPRCETSVITPKSKWVSSQTLTPQWQEVGPWLTTTGQAVA